MYIHMAVYIYILYYIYTDICPPSPTGFLPLHLWTTKRSETPCHPWQGIDFLALWAAKSNHSNQKNHGANEDKHQVFSGIFERITVPKSSFWNQKLNHHESYYIIPNWSKLTTYSVYSVYAWLVPWPASAKAKTWTAWMLLKVCLS